MKQLLKISLLLFPLWITSCATSNYGSFVASSYIEPGVENELLGTVEGESRQTLILYLFPQGDAPSIKQAVRDAKSKIPGTKFLTDIAIDDRTDWGFGYSERIIRIEAKAYK